jgi:hypothetical protein
MHAQVREREAARREAAQADEAAEVGYREATQLLDQLSLKVGERCGVLRVLPVPCVERAVRDVEPCCVVLGGRGGCSRWAIGVLCVMFVFVMCVLCHAARAVVFLVPCVVCVLRQAVQGLGRAKLWGLKAHRALTPPAPPAPAHPCCAVRAAMLCVVRTYVPPPLCCAVLLVERACVCAHTCVWAPGSPRRVAAPCRALCFVLDAGLGWAGLRWAGTVCVAPGPLRLVTACPARPAPPIPRSGLALPEP